MVIPPTSLDIEAHSHQVSERPLALGQALDVRQPASIRADPPEVNPDTREAIFLVDSCPETYL